MHLHIKEEKPEKKSTCARIIVACLLALGLLTALAALGAFLYKKCKSCHRCTVSVGDNTTCEDEDDELSDTADIDDTDVDCGYDDKSEE